MANFSEEASGHRTKARNTTIILILGALTTISPLSIDMYLAASPNIAASLGSTVAQVSLSLSAYFIGVTIGQLFYGPLLDHYGRKRPLYAGLSLFVLASIGCMVVDSVPHFIALRVLQALGGCVAQVGAMAMIQDFFPEKDRAKVFSLLILILGVSPLLAPTIGSFISVYLAWQWIFACLAIIAAAIGFCAHLFLPEGHKPDEGVRLQLMPILRTYGRILAAPRFLVFALGSALPFCGLFAYVAGSPLIFMDVFHVDARFYDGIFAFLSIGFIGASQLNIVLLRRFDSLTIFITAIIGQCIIGLAFLICAWQGWLGLYGVILFLLAYLSCTGLLGPNGSTLALAPFTDNAGSASALLGVMQIGFGAIVSGLVGMIANPSVTPVVAIMVAAAWGGALVLLIGRRTLAQIRLSSVSAAV